MKISDIEWGDDSAKRDQQFPQYFMTSDALQRLSRKTKMLMVGRKGAGKSTLQAKLKQIFSEFASDTAAPKFV